MVSGDNTHLTNSLHLNRNVAGCMKPELASRGCCGCRTVVLFSSPWETKRVKETRTCASVMVQLSLLKPEYVLIHPKPFYYSNILFVAQQPADHTHLNTSWRCSQSGRKQLPVLFYNAKKQTCAKFRMKESAFNERISVYTCELNWPHLTGSWI